MPEKHFSCHICTTGQLFSLRPVGAPMDERSAVFTGHRYGAGPDAVITSYGIQGEDYFKAFRECLAEIMHGAFAIQGYVWRRHVNIYRRTLRGVAQVDELFSGHPYGEDGPEFVWVFVRRLDGQGQPIGPKVIWDD